MKEIVIYFKNGSNLDCLLVSEDDESVIIRVDDSTLKISKEDIIAIGE